MPEAGRSHATAPFRTAVLSAGLVALLAALSPAPADARPRFGPRAVLGILTAPLGVFSGGAGRRARHYYRHRAARTQSARRARVAAGAAAMALTARPSWVGPVFWPDGGADMFGYVLLAGEQDARFWSGGFADVVAGVLGAETVRRRVTADAGTTGAGAALAACGAGTRSTVDVAAALERVVQPTEAQQPAFATLRTALQRVGDDLARACPPDVPMAPSARLATIRERLWALQSAALTVRGPLAELHATLDDAQKARLDGAPAGSPGPDRSSALAGSPAGLCHMQAQAESQAAATRLRAALRLGADQEAGLRSLTDVSGGMAKLMVASCPVEPPSTAIGRLDAVLGRLDAMLYALGVVATPLQGFYGGLSDEQKARFNAVGASSS